MNVDPWTTTRQGKARQSELLYIREMFKPESSRFLLLVQLHYTAIAMTHGFTTPYVQVFAR